MEQLYRILSRSKGLFWNDREQAWVDMAHSETFCALYVCRFKESSLTSLRVTDLYAEHKYIISYKCSPEDYHTLHYPGVRIQTDDRAMSEIRGTFGLSFTHDLTELFETGKQTVNNSNYTYYLELMHC